MYYICFKTFLLAFLSLSYAFIVNGGRRKREVTVITRNAGDPCPIVVDNNRNIGVGLQYGPRYFGDFFGQGYNTRKNANWGFDVGSPGFGLNRGFNFQLPLGAGIVVPPKRYSSDCNPYSSQTQFIGPHQRTLSRQSRIVRHSQYQDTVNVRSNTYSSLPFRPSAVWKQPT